MPCKIALAAAALILCAPLASCGDMPASADDEKISL